MSRHLNALPNSIAKYVIIAGNPERTTAMAKKFLTNYKMVSDNRLAYVYTGEYQGVEISFATHGMGLGSAMIYFRELFIDYNVEVIIRAGTTGALTLENELFDVINARDAFSKTKSYKEITGDQDVFSADEEIFSLIKEAAAKRKIKIFNDRFFTSENFYYQKEQNKFAIEKNCRVVEMETFGLFALAHKLNKKAATVGMIVDYVVPGVKTPESNFQDRITGLNNCYLLALDAIVSFTKQQ